MTHHPNCDGDCPVAGCDIPNNVKLGGTNGWRAQAYANYDIALRLETANAALRDSVEYLDRYIEQLLQTIEHLESEIHLLSDHVSALELENGALTDKVAVLRSNLDWFI